MKKYTRIPSLVIAGTIASAASSQAATIFSDDFNSYDSVTGGATPLTSNWSIVNNSTSVALGATGISGTQAIDFNNLGGGGETGLVNNATINISSAAAGTKWTMTGYFLMESIQNNGNAVPGWTFRSDNTGSITSASHLMGRVNGSGGLNILNDGGGIASFGSNLVTVGNWYFLQFDITKTATANTFDAKVELFNSSNSGVVGGSLGSTSVTTANSVLYADTTTYAGFRDGVHSGGSSRAGIIDNITVFNNVPEPTSVTLLGLGGLALVIRRQRRA